MALTIEETTLVGTPPEAIWRLLADPTCWRLWWPACLEAEAKDRRPLHDGSELDLLLKPTWIAMRVRPTVEVASPARALIWRGTSAGLTGRHAFYLDAKPNGTLVRQREEFSGWGLVPFRLLRLDVATRRMFRDNLRGLKKLAERSL
jgi:hypothetical protein